MTLSLMGRMESGKGGRVIIIKNIWVGKRSENTNLRQGWPAELYDFLPQNPGIYIYDTELAHVP